MEYRELNNELTIETLQKLKLRINDRFPKSGLENVCGELLKVAEESKAKIAFISKPLLWLRIVLVSVVLLTFTILFLTISTLNVETGQFNMIDLISIAEASINDLILIGAALYFLAKTETRIKRNRALDALHEIRSIAHVIDMHQLTKDPKNISENNTANSPTRSMTLFELSRYLDYSSEMLALCSKISALYANGFKDEVVLQTINEIEGLTTSLSRKIWQKISVLDISKG
ncbi:MAG: hypothetical protein GQ574_15485 [Crocinitomix sp.]|nr:hypothetical protein [Crocinitomix sp.]